MKGVGGRTGSSATLHPTPYTLHPPADARETHRIRIGNRAGGAIEISLDGGRDWMTVGRVTHPATNTGAGFAALAAAAPGSVAAISLDGLTVRTDHPPAPAADAKPRIFRLLPAGAAAGTASIVTNLPRGHVIFGELAPPLGSRLLLEDAAGSPRPLPGGYIPQAGDHLVIIAAAPASPPAMLVFENKEGGRVLAVSPAGDETVVGQVKRPLRGVGRYAATEGAACGGVVSCHPAAIVVASAPAKSGEAGGFLIQPAASGAALKPEDGSVLQVAPLQTDGALFGLPIELSPAGGSLAGETRVEARLDGGPWEPLPAAAGAAPAALTGAALTQQFASLGSPRHLTDGVTHLRLVLARPSPERLRAALAAAAADQRPRLAVAPEHALLASPAPHPTRSHAGLKTPAPRKAAVKSGRKGTLRIVANIQGRGIVYVMFYVDGHIRKLTNTPPFEWLWDTRTTPNGLHSLEIRGADADGRILTTQTQEVAIGN